MAQEVKVRPRQKSGVVAKQPSKRNSSINWNRFDPDRYWQHNYRTLRDDDRQIIEKVGEHFAAANIPAGAHGLDVGSGANLYPALSMLPFCERLDLWEYGTSNVRWLNKQIPRYSESWDPFWATFERLPAYTVVRDPRSKFSQIAKVTQRSIFDLPQRTWDVGTMFFVACSMSTDRSEFVAAVHAFVRAMKTDAPFAAAFMTGSEGYPVGGSLYPAVPVEDDDIRASLDEVAHDVVVHDILTGSPLRQGYRGMSLAVGRASG